MSNPLILTKGFVPDEADTREYVPEVSLDHEGTELFVIVGEEAAGMAEGVSAEAWDDIVARITRLERLEKILDVLDRDGGSLVIRCDHEKDRGRDWSLMSVFGSEAEDSPMAGGSHIGAGDTLDECLASAVK